MLSTSCTHAHIRMYIQTHTQTHGHTQHTLGLQQIPLLVSRYSVILANKIPNYLLTPHIVYLVIIERKSFQKCWLSAILKTKFPKTKHKYTAKLLLLLCSYFKIFKILHSLQIFYKCSHSKIIHIWHWILQIVTDYHI